jgi:hypothetical protein
MSDRNPSGLPASFTDRAYLDGYEAGFTRAKSETQDEIDKLREALTSANETIVTLSQKFTAENEKLLADWTQQVEGQDALWDTLEKIKTWCEAYPLDIFPEPDLLRARTLLEEGDITLDSVAAHCMRHVLKGVIEIIDTTEQPNLPENPFHEKPT